MNRPSVADPAAAAHTAAKETSEPSRVLSEGWHCGHYYYRFDRASLATQSATQRSQAREALIATLESPAARPAQLQTFLVSGHKADFGMMVLDADPLNVDGVHQQLLASPLGPALVPTYSFVSMTELSEYVPTPQQYAQRLLDEGADRDSPAFAGKVKAYEQREPMMRAQRLTPELPQWPAMCFYPMNKKRVPGENWFTTPFSQRTAMMSEHARSGMAFAGRVTQLITVSIGLDDWEWGVTLWAKNPQFLKDIVYRMRFDEASARYAEFGPFHTGYLANAEEIGGHCLL